MLPLVIYMYYVLIEALRHGEASLVTPFKYTGLIWAMVFGFVLWGDVPEATVIVGAALVAWSGLSLLRAERRRPNPT